MSVIALLCLLPGFLSQEILDGRAFTRAVPGIILGMVAGVTGIAAARKDPPHRWEGRIRAVLEIAILTWCMAMLPSSSRFQKQFNSKTEEIRLRPRDSKPASQVPVETAHTPAGPPR